jgi:hypothetical protein
MQVQVLEGLPTVSAGTMKKHCNWRNSTSPPDRLSDCKFLFSIRSLQMGVQKF